MGRRIGQRYELGEVIGSGATSTVHVGRLHGSSGFTKVIALKRLHAHLASDEKLRAILMDEARVVSRISHPNVVAVLDVAEHEGEVILVLEYARGATLAELLGVGAVPPAVAIAVVGDVLGGLHAAHHARDAAGAPLELVHRDVSPRNVMVTTEGVGKILDFGIAKARARMSTTRDGQIRGSLPYMAPEQVRDEPLTAQTDVYAASVVLWEALTGRRLFEGESDAAVLQKVLDHDVPPPSTIVPSLPRALDAVVSKGLASTPADRFASGLEMAVALAAALAPASREEIAAYVTRVHESELSAREARIPAYRAETSESPVVTAVPSPPPRRPRFALAAAATFGAVLFVIALATVSRRTESATTEPARSLERAALPSSAPPMPEPSAAPAPSEPIAASAPPSPSPSPPPPRAVTSPVAAARASVAPSSAPLPAVSAAPKGSACPPYYVDATGVRRFNRECLQ